MEKGKSLEFESVMYIFMKKYLNDFNPDIFVTHQNIKLKSIKFLEKNDKE